LRQEDRVRIAISDRQLKQAKEKNLRKEVAKDKPDQESGWEHRDFERASARSEEGEGEQGRWGRESCDGGEEGPQSSGGLYNTVSEGTSTSRSRQKKNVKNRKEVRGGSAKMLLFGRKKALREPAWIDRLDRKEKVWNHPI